MPNTNSVKSIIKAFAIIEELDRNGSMSIAEISNSLEMDKSTVHRIVNTVKEAGYITQNRENQRYENGIKLFEVGQGVIDRIGLNIVARPYLEKMAKLTGETISLAMRMGCKIIFIDIIESNSTIKVGINIGTVLPIYCTGLGKAVLAYTPEEEKSQIIKHLKLEKMTENTITDEEILTRHLEMIKERGYSMDNEEYISGLICFGAPIFDYRGAPIAAVSVSFPILRYKTEHNNEYPELVKKYAIKISRRMGYN